MLICVGGLLGSGRKDFARRLGKRLDFYVYDFESHMRTSLLLRGFRHGGAHTYDTLSDSLRLRMFEHVARDFAHLSSTFRNVIIDEPFHRNIPRTFLFEQGKKDFKRVTFVWVEETEKSIEEKVQWVLSQNPRHTAGKVQNIIEQMEQEFEPFAPPPIFARNAMSNALVLEEVAAKILA